jgi:imidazoleglycerol-phosphate dehydratase
MRNSNIDRATNETNIKLSLVLDGTGKHDIRTGSGFFDHMLVQIAVHGKFDLAIDCTGDIEVDCHHTVEDVGIVLGKSFAEAIGDKRGISRYGSVLLPMDESLALASCDISGRAHLSFDATFPTSRVGEFDAELVKEFFLAFTRAAAVTLHIKLLAAENTHHAIEGIFKAFGRALCKACHWDRTVGGEIPSTKGIL